MPHKYTKLITQELAEVQNNIDRAMVIKAGPLKSFAYLDFNEMTQNLIPSLVLLVVRLFDYHEQKAAGLATVLQFVFMADRVHIAISDHDLDPKDPSRDVREGAPLPVLVGDLLYGRFYTTLCAYDLYEFLNPVAQIIAVMNLGAMHRREVWEAKAAVESAVSLIEEETASIFASSCQMAANLAGASGDDCQKMRGFGLALGTGYGLLERGVGVHEAKPYFEQALALLGGYSAHQSWASLEDMVRGLAEGRYAVSARKVGESIKTLDKEEYVLDRTFSMAKWYDVVKAVLSFNKNKKI